MTLGSGIMRRSMADGGRRARGISLLEILVVVAIVGILATLAFWGLGAVVPGYRLNTARREVAQLLVLARARAIAQNRYYLVRFATNGYEVIWDRAGDGAMNGPDTVEQSGTYPAGVTYERPLAGESPLPAGDLVGFDFRGQAFNITPAGQRIRLRNSSGTQDIQVRFSGLVRTL